MKRRFAILTISYLILLSLLLIGSPLWDNLPHSTYAARTAETTVGTGTPGSCTESALDDALSQGGTITFNCGDSPHTIDISSTKVINSEVSLDGGGRITISGNNSVRIFRVRENGVLSLSSMTLTNGKTGGDGGAVWVEEGSVSLTNVNVTGNQAGRGGGIAGTWKGTIEIVGGSISDNVASSGDGGGVLMNHTTASIHSATIARNSSNGNGGAISFYRERNTGGPLEIDGVTIAYNTAKNVGGAISASGSGKPDGLHIVNTTIVGNTAKNSGAIYNYQYRSTITNATLAYNEASEFTTGIFNSNAELTMRNTILVNPPGSARDNCANEGGTFTDGGGNIEFPSTSCASATGGNILSADPLLVDLADNGGATETMALGRGSPAIDGGSSDNCPATDQRGVTRPYDGNQDGVTVCDSGAFEVGADDTPPSADNVVGDGTPESCTEDALLKAVERSGYITFNCGDEHHTITVGDDVRITRNTTIDGGGSAQGGNITISGGNATRVFITDNHTTFTLRNITIADGKEAGDGSGSGLRTGWRTTTTIANSIFRNNDGRSGGNERGGGAIATDSETVLLIYDSLFEQNTGINGGAINNLLSTLTVVGTTFVNNVSETNNSGNHGMGGAIYTDGASKNDGTKGAITIRDSVFRNNQGDFSGGAVHAWVYPPDEVIVERSIFDSNTVLAENGRDAYGGGFRHGNGDLTLSHTVFSNNRSEFQGGAFWRGGSDTENYPALLTNVTFYNNRAAKDDTSEVGLGGAIAGAGNLLCTNCTMMNNYAGEFAGAIYNEHEMTVKNSLIISNTANNQWQIDQQCYQYLTDGGGNMQFPDKLTDADEDNSCFQTATIADPKLGSLADNGGPTETLALNDGSPAIDAGQADGCPKFDQRGAERPVDGDSDGSTACDVGAYEFNSPAPDAWPFEHVFLPIIAQR